MFLFAILGSIAICILIGFVAGKLMTGSSYGMKVNLVLGFFGAVVGALLLKLLGLRARGILWPFLLSTIGAVIIVWLVRLFRGRTV